jgi:hypothetical protein
MFEPIAADPGPLLVIERSALAVRFVVAVELLFAELESAVAEETVAVFEMLAPAFAFTTREIVGEAPLLTVPRLQVTVLVPEQDPTEGVADTKVVPAGRTSVTLTLAALLGPALFTVMVYVMLEPAAAVAGPLLVIDRSAFAVTFVLAVELLLPGVGSEVVADTVAVFERLATVFAVTTRAIVGDAPALTVPRLQVTVLVPEHEPTEGVAETKVVPAGSVSLTVTPAALLGPEFVTVML